MKKKVLKVVAGATLVAIMAVGMQMKNSKVNLFSTLDGFKSIALAQDEINSDCPNGCVAGLTSCVCYDYYVNLKEYKW
jgi:hypothetical protein